MTAWERAVEAMAMEPADRVFRQLCSGCRKDGEPCADHRRVARERLALAAPHLERHFRALFEAELAKRQEKR